MTTVPIARVLNVLCLVLLGGFGCALLKRMEALDNKFSMKLANIEAHDTEKEAATENRVRVLERATQMLEAVARKAAEPFQGRSPLHPRYATNASLLNLAKSARDGYQSAAPFPNIVLEEVRLRRRSVAPVLEVVALVREELSVRSDRMLWLCVGDSASVLRDCSVFLSIASNLDSDLIVRSLASLPFHVCACRDHICPPDAGGPHTRVTRECGRAFAKKCRR